jgi:hypothetical protein
LTAQLVGTKKAPLWYTLNDNGALVMGESPLVEKAYQKWLRNEFAAVQFRNELSNLDIDFATASVSRFRQVEGFVLCSPCQ